MSNLNLGVFDLAANEKRVEKLRKSLTKECRSSRVLETYGVLFQVHFLYAIWIRKESTPQFRIK